MSQRHARFALCETLVYNFIIQNEPVRLVNIEGYLPHLKPQYVALVLKSLLEQRKIYVADSLTPPEYFVMSLPIEE